MGCGDLFHRWMSRRDSKAISNTSPFSYSLCLKLGAYLVESSLGRRWSLAGSTFITAFFCVVFIKVTGPLALKASTVGISLSATVCNSPYLSRLLRLTHG